MTTLIWIACGLVAVADCVGIGFVISRYFQARAEWRRFQRERLLERTERDQ